MSDPIFALPRYDYASYRDLYALIGLSGFQTCYTDEIDPASDNTYICTMLNGEIPADGWQGRRARILLYDLEWHLDGVPPIFDEVWVGDAWYARQIGARYVPMGSHPDLRPNADSTWHERYDVAYIGYINGVARRERMRQRLRENGVKVSPTGAWGDDRHRILSNSAVYLNVHQWDNIPTLPPLRMVIAAAYALPVVSETVADAGLFEGRILQLHYNWVAETLPHVLHDKPTMEMCGHLHQLLCVDRTFRKSIEAAL